MIKRTYLLVGLVFAAAVFSSVGFAASNTVYFEDFRDGTIDTPFSSINANLDGSAGNNYMTIDGNGLTLFTNTTGTYMLYGSGNSGAYYVPAGSYSSIVEGLTVSFAASDKGTLGDCDVGSSYAVGVLNVATLDGYIFNVVHYSADGGSCTGGFVEIYQVTNGVPTFVNTASLYGNFNPVSGQEFTVSFIYNADGTVQIYEDSNLEADITVAPVSGDITVAFGRHDTYDESAVGQPNEWTRFGIAEETYYTPPAASSLAISDFTDVVDGQTYTAWADYTDTSGADIVGATCTLQYGDYFVTMNYNSGAGRYEADFTANSTITAYVVSCSHPDYQAQTLTDTFTVSAQPVAEPQPSGQYSQQLSDLGTGMNSLIMGVGTKLVAFVVALSVGIALVGTVSGKIV